MIITTHNDGKLSVDKISAARPSEMLNVSIDVQHAAIPDSYRGDDIIRDIEAGAYGTYVGYSVFDKDNSDCRYYGTISSGGSIILGSNFTAIVYQRGLVKFNLLVTYGWDGYCQMLSASPLKNLMTRASQLMGTEPLSFAVVEDAIVEVFPDGASLAAFPEFDFGVIDGNNSLVQAYGISTGTWNMDLVPTNSKGFRRSLMNRFRGLPSIKKFDSNEGIYKEGTEWVKEFKDALKMGDSIEKFTNRVASYEKPVSQALLNAGILNMAIRPNREVIMKHITNISSVLFDYTEPGFDAMIASLARTAQDVTLEERADLLSNSTAIVLSGVLFNEILKEYNSKYDELLYDGVSTAREKLYNACAEGRIAIAEIESSDLSCNSLADTTMFNPEASIKIDVTIPSEKVSSINNLSDFISVGTEICSATKNILLPIESLKSADKMAILDHPIYRDGKFVASTSAPNLDFVVNTKAIESIKGVARKKAKLLSERLTNAVRSLCGAEAFGEAYGFHSISEWLPGNGVTYAHGDSREFVEEHWCHVTDKATINLFHPKKHIETTSDLQGLLYGAVDAPIINVSESGEVSLKWDHGDKTRSEFMMENTKLSNVRVRNIKGVTYVNFDLQIPFISAVARWANVLDVGSFGSNWIANCFKLEFDDVKVVNLGESATFKGQRVRKISSDAFLVGEGYYKYFSNAGTDSDSAYSFADKSEYKCYRAYQAVAPWNYRVNLTLRPDEKFVTVDGPIDTALRVTNDDLPTVELFQSVSDCLSLGSRQLTSYAQKASLDWLIDALESAGLLGDVKLIGSATFGGVTKLVSTGTLAALTDATLSDDSIAQVIEDLANAKGIHGASSNALADANKEGYKIALLELANSIRSFARQSYDKVWIKSGLKPIFKKGDWDLAGWYLKS